MLAEIEDMRAAVVVGIRGLCPGTAYHISTHQLTTYLRLSHLDVTAAQVFIARKS